MASERNDAEAYRPDPLPALVQAVRGMVGRLFEFLALTEDEWFEGQHLPGGMEQDR